MEDSITVYSSPTCPRCKMLKMELSKRGLSFLVCEDEQQILAETGSVNIPMMKINNEAPMGFKEAIDWIKRL